MRSTPAARRQLALPTTVLLLFAVSTVVLRVTAHSLATKRTCTVPAATLTFDCDSECNTKYQPCWHNASLTATADSCMYECYNIYYYDASQSEFVFLVPYGTWKSAQQIASGDTSSDASDSASGTNDTTKYISKNNNYLTTVDALLLPSTTTSVSISGGSYFRTNTVKGRVSNVTFADDFLTTQTQVQNVYLGNLNLAPTLAKMTTILPPSVKTIDFTNGLLTTFPADFAQFATLQELTLTNNYIATVDASSAIDTISLLAVNLNNVSYFDAVFKNATLVALSVNALTEFPAVFTQYPRLDTLYLDHNSISAVESSHAVQSVTSLYLGVNQITTFEAVFPSLTFLDLRQNNLTEIPAAIFQHKKLTTLNLAGNPLKNLTLTNSQAAFLINLKNLTFDGTVFKDCFVSEQKDVQGTRFCIVAGGDNGVDNSGGSSTGLIIGIVCGIVALIAVAAFFCLRARRNRKNQDTYNGTAQSQGTSASGTTTASLWNDAALLSVKVSADDIEDIKPIGKGAYGDVWLVKYRNSRLLASKRLRKGETSQSKTQNFIEEIKLVAKLEHPKIVQFVGAAWTIEADLQALFEYMEGGDLRMYLDNPRTSSVWTHEKLQIAIDIAEALVYVHSFSPPLVHRDIKSRNILLSAELEAKLTDFGASRYRSEENTMTSGVGTGRWLAPEVISGSSDYGPPADIFSFGAMLTELDSHQLPYDEVRGPNGGNLVDVALLQMISTGQVTPGFTSSCPDKIVEIGTRCFAFDPTSRPTAAEIAYQLRQIKKSMYTVI
ncbi:Tkl protein kinase [Globisporangium polare]